MVERGAIPAEEGLTRVMRYGCAGSRCRPGRGRFEDPVAQAKSLMRLLINHSLNGQELATRAMVRDLQRLEDSL